MHRVMVTGSRDLIREVHGRVLWTALGFEREYAEFHGKEMTLVHGACPTGADAFAEDWYWHMIDDGRVGLYIERYPADWSAYGKFAGPKRNKQMVDSKPDIVLAFPLGESKGTRGTMKMALAAGIPVKQLGE